MNIKENFNQFYNKFLKQNNFDEIEMARQNYIREKKINKSLITASIIIPLILTFIVIGLSKNKNAEISETFGPFFFCMSWIAPVFVAIFRSTKHLKYHKIYEEKVITSLIRSFSSTIQYYPNEGIDCEDFKKMQFKNFNTFHSFDLIKGLYLNNEINISTVVTQYSINNSTYLKFNGSFAKFKLPQKSIFELYLKCKDEKNLLINNCTQIDINELDNIFDIYTSHPELAEKILDSNMIEILTNIYDKMKFEILIKDSHIYMKFFDAPLFSISISEKETFDRRNILKNYEKLYIIFYFISKFEEQIYF